MYPDDLRYTKDHEWVRLKGDRGTVGITHYAQKQLGDVVYLELPEVGRALLSPVAGEVVEVNGALVQAPEKINSDPYGDAWMIAIRLADPTAVKALMDAGAYKAFVESESK
jgi:glycine cleavage system H protein